MVIFTPTWIRLMRSLGGKRKWLDDLSEAGNGVTRVTFIRDRIGSVGDL